MTDLPEKICGCGSCRDALKAAERVREQTLENQCPVWGIQVAYALIHIHAADLMTLDEKAGDKVDPRKTFRQTKAIEDLMVNHIAEDSMERIDALNNSRN